MITYRELKDCRKLALEADQLRERIMRLQARGEGGGACASGTPGSGAAGDPVGNAVAEIAQLRDRWSCVIRDYVALVARVDEAIAMMESPEQRTIMGLRYIDALTWGEIAKTMQYSRSWLTQQHRRAVEVFRKVCAQMRIET